jgi:Domain of unknown function (DUF4148)
MTISLLNRVCIRSVSVSLMNGAAMLLTSTCLYAQTLPKSEPHQVTRAEVLRELKELESVGYRPAPNDIYYPADLQEALQRLEVRHQAEKNAAAAASQPGPEGTVR